MWPITLSTVYKTEGIHHNFERVVGLEPTSPDWKSGTLTSVLHPHFALPTSCSANRIGGVWSRLESNQHLWIFSPPPWPPWLLLHFGSGVSLILTTPEGITTNIGCLGTTSRVFTALPNANTWFRQLNIREASYAPRTHTSKESWLLFDA